MPWKECYGYGRETPVCGSPASRRAMTELWQGVWYLPQDRLKIFDRYQDCWHSGLTTEVGVLIATPPASVSGGNFYLECET